MQFLFFILFIISVLTLGSVTIGPLSVRVYLTVLMILYLLFAKKKEPKVLEIDRWYIKVYVLFILYMPFALIVNGGFPIFNYFHSLAALYLVGIVAYFAVDQFIGREKDIENLVFALSLVVLVDSVITIMQFQGSVIGWAIGNAFADLSKTMDYLEANEFDLGLSVVAGIMGGSVGNGFFLAVCTPLFFTAFFGKKKVITKIYYVVIIFLALLACFYTQQRAAFFLLLAAAVYFISRVFTKKKNFIVPGIAAILLVFYLLYEGLSFIEMGRLTTNDNSDRVMLLEAAFSAISNNVLFGNPVGYYRMVSMSVHNVLLDSLITTGLIGAIIMSVLYFKTVILSVKLNIRKAPIISDRTRIIATSVLIAMILGLFHNTSYYTGEVLVFITLALMLKSNNLDNLRKL